MDADEVVEALDRIADELDEARRQVEHLSAERDRLVWHLHHAEGWSYADIADASGLSRSRVQQIVERHRHVVEGE